MTREGFADFGWAFDADPSTGLMRVFSPGQWWLLPTFLALLAATVVQLFVPDPVRRARLTLGISIAGLAASALQGLVIVFKGPRLFENLLSGPVIDAGQSSMGIGAALCMIALLFAATVSLSQSGKGQGDAFVVSTIGLIMALVAVFVFFPMMHILVRAFEVKDGYSLVEFYPLFFSSDIWGFGCLIGARACGVAINSLFLAIMTGLGTTLLGLSFALIFTRTDFRAKELLRILTVLPIITPHSSSVSH